MKSKRSRKSDIPRLLGIGHDSDGHRRVTKADSIVVVGGTKETHEQLQEQAIRINEEAAKRGRDISQMSFNEVQDIVERVVH